MVFKFTAHKPFSFFGKQTQTINVKNIFLDLTIRVFAVHNFNDFLSIN